MGNLSKKSFTNLGGAASWTAPAGVTSVTVVSQLSRSPFVAGNGLAGIIDAGGNLYLTGKNTQGQIGNNSTTDANSFVLPNGGLQFPQASSYMTQNNCSVIGLTPAGICYAWGDNTSGQLGTNDSTGRSTPTAVVGGLVFNQIFTSIAPGNGGFVLGLTSSGQLYSWGDNTQGQLGNGNTTSQSSPVQVLGGLIFSQVAAIGETVYALTSGATPSLYAWGRNNNGQLGNGNTTSQSSPILVLGGISFVTVPVNNAAVSNLGNLSVSALDNTGKAYAWGGNGNGQLGVGDVTPRSSPVAVLGSLKFSQIFCAETNNSNVYMAGLTTAGVAYAWGTNNFGQLGLNDTTPRSSPVAVLGSLTFASISNNVQTMYGVTTAGVGYAWGQGGSGALGDGNGAAHAISSPVAVTGSLTFAQIYGVYSGSAVAGSAFGVTTTGIIYGWGSGSNGMNGVGTGSTASSPTLVSPSSLTPFVQPTIQTTVIPVVPNTSYTISLFQGIVTFGNTQVARGPASSVTLYYEQ